MGGHLPGEKVTPEIAKIRNKPLGQDVISPSRFPDITTKEELKDLVEQLPQVYLRSMLCTEQENIWTVWDQILTL